MNLGNWIGARTTSCSSVLEFGAGRLEWARFVHPSVAWNGGIEIFAPYMEEPTPAPRDYVKILGDMREWKKIVPAGFVPDCAMFIDSLEHLELNEGYALVRDLQKSFRKILLFIPLGLHEQTADAWGMGNDYHQAHKSTWQEEDVRSLGFVGDVDPTYHPHDPAKSSRAAMFATWERG